MNEYNQDPNQNQYKNQNPDQNINQAYGQQQPYLDSNQTPPAQAPPPKRLNFKFNILYSVTHVVKNLVSIILECVTITINKYTLGLKGKDVARANILILILAIFAGLFGADIFKVLQFGTISCITSIGGILIFAGIEEAMDAYKMAFMEMFESKKVKEERKKREQEEKEAPPEYMVNNINENLKQSLDKANSVDSLFNMELNRKNHEINKRESIDLETDDIWSESTKGLFDDEGEEGTNNSESNQTKDYASTNSLSVENDFEDIFGKDIFDDFEGKLY